MSEFPDTDVDRTAAAPVQAPRWYHVSLLVLMSLAAVQLAVSQQFVLAVIFGVGIALAVVLEFVIMPRVRRRGKARAANTSYGSSCLLGFVFTATGILDLAVGAQLWVGGMMIGFGVLTLIAFGPGYMRYRRALRAR